MIWLVTLGGFALGCVVAYAMISRDDDQDGEG
jgi:hypothetical protein